MSRFRKALMGAGLVSVAVASVGYAQQQQRPATPAAPAAQAQPAPARPATTPLPWARSENAQILGARVAPSDTLAPPTRRFGLGREATAAEIRGWDIDIRPDGHGIPVGRGSVKEGEELYLAQCASCHGDFGESAGRWPILSGGQQTLNTHDPVKSVGSFWPYVTTLVDYIHRTMPFGNAQSLTWDQTYAIAAYVLYVNDLITDNDFVLSNENLLTIRMPNEANFYPDDRETTERHLWNREVCMTNCAPTPAQVTGRARVLDVTPDTQGQRGARVD